MSTKSFRDQTSPEVRDWRSMIRRMAITLTDGGTWQAIGHILLGGAKEVRPVDVFSGVGFFARPPAGANAEALVVFTGGSSNPIAVATRDEDTRRKVAGALAQDETAMFNRLVIAVIKAIGTMEIRSASGTALGLPTMADFAGIVSIMNAAGTGAATALPAAVTAYQAAHPTWPVGTTVLKAQ